MLDASGSVPSHVVRPMEQVLPDGTLPRILSRICSA
jgi:hypothetical protein